MEWVETTGQSIEEAQAKALDLLNVDGTDAEIEVLEDVKKGLFGRVKSDARVRARIRPKAPAPKDDRRNRRGGSNKSRNEGAGRSRGNQKRSGGNSGDGKSGGGKNRSGGGSKSGSQKSDGRSGNNDRSGGDRGGQNKRGGSQGAAAGAVAAGAVAAGSDDVSTDTSADSGANSGARDGGNRNDGRNSNRNNNKSNNGRSGRNREESAVDEEFSVADQQQIMQDFVGGVAAVFDSGSSTTVVDLGDDTLEAQVSGENLGLLVGPSGATLAALEDLTRTAMQRSAGGRRYHRIHVDVDEYKSRRRAALAGFAQSIAEQVKDSGERKALESMNAADRKVVHDALTDVEGVVTLSEGEDPRRYVVIAPE